MTEISLVFVDGSKARFTTMTLKTEYTEYLTSLNSDEEFMCFYREDGALTLVRFDQIRRLSVKEIAVV